MKELLAGIAAALVALALLILTLYLASVTDTGRIASTYAGIKRPHTHVLPIE